MVGDVARPDAPPDDVAIHHEAVASSAGDVTCTARPVSFRLLASVADLTQGEPRQIARIVAAHLGIEVPDDPATLLQSLQPRLDCAIHYATELVPETQRTRVRTAFAADVHAALASPMRRAVDELAGGMAGDWTLEALTALVYAIPKRLLGLGPDDEPTAEVKAAQRDFFRVVYRLLVDAETGPRLPTLLLSIGAAHARELLVGPQRVI